MTNEVETIRARQRARRASDEELADAHRNELAKLRREETANTMRTHKLTDLQQAMVEHDDDMARLDRNTMKTEMTVGNDTELAPAVDDCECDNTHYQNQTVCMPCWNAGIRFETAYWPEHLKHGATTKKKCKMSGAGECRDQYDSILDDQPPTRAAERPVEHTPTPWRVLDGAILSSLVNDYGNFVVVTCDRERTPQDEVNLQLIATTVNAHATLLRQKRELVEALEACQGFLHQESCEHGDEADDLLPPDPENCLNCKVNAALNAAVGEGEGGR